MTDLNLLKKTIKNRGYMLSYIAAKLDVCRQTLYSRLKGRSEFTDEEIETLVRVLRLTREERNKIFW